MVVAANHDYQPISSSGVVAFGGVPTGPAGVRENRGAGAACSTPSAVDHRRPRPQVLVLRGFGPRQHRRDARVGAREDRRSTRRGSCSRTGRRRSCASRDTHRFRTGRAPRRPTDRGRRAIPRRTAARSRRPPCTCRRRSRRCGRTGRRRRAGTTRARRAGTGRLHRPHHLRQDADAVDHRGVDHLSLAGPLPLVERGDDAQQHEHRAAAEVGDQVQRRDRRPVAVADRRQRTGLRQVVDVVAGRHRQRPVLTPAGDAREDQPRVDRRAVVRPDAEPLAGAGPEAVQQHVGLGGQVQQRLRLAS